MRSKKRISEKVFKELASKNVKKSAKDYFIYFFTLTFAVCLFYTFNSIEAQFSSLGLHDSLNYLAASQWAMAGVSVFVCIIIGFLVVYANRFLMKRRKREFGIYSVLGMDKKDLEHLLMKETLRIGGAALVFGFLLGIVLSQGLSMITAKMANAGLDHYSFIISGKALLEAVVFFGLTFLFVHLFNVREIRKKKLIELLSDGRKNEEIKEASKGNVLMGILSILLMIAGYLSMFKLFDDDLKQSVMVGGGLLSVGTVLFFLSVAGVMMKVLKKRKGIYYRKLNLFVVNQLSSRMKAAGISIAVVCVLMYLSVSVMGVGMGMGQSSISEKKQMAPYDVSVIYYYEGGMKNEIIDRGSVESELEKQKAQLPEHLKKTAEITLYKEKKLTSSKLFLKGYTANRNEQKFFGKAPVVMIGLSDYNKIRKLQGEKPITLEKNQYAISYNEPMAEKALNHYMTSEAQAVKVGGESLSLKPQGLYKTTLYNRNVLLDSGTLIVPQNLLKNESPLMKTLNGMFQTGDEEAYATFLQDRRNTEDFDFQSRTDIYVEALSNQLTASYIGVYLGIVFLVTAGAVLALQQLIQSSDNQRRYALLYKLGAGAKAMKRSLLAQLEIYFGLPFALAAVHSAIIMGGMFRGIPYLTGADVARNVIFAAGVAVTVYGIYFITTYAASKRILKV
ncbi:ABC transporter permease [Anaerovorax odorimutans]|uniref:ABC transporter permease n=1 Tax=Anaerovorax odorimutans TaxID=109327 RepID=A0ABT1RPK1_9FIRM|nr:ABC transporter permease [Anaerovorax odorimutans]MCQ4637096.1 ABC transporter permease [Anaerovorax odorimutans]